MRFIERDLSNRRTTALTEEEDCDERDPPVIWDFLRQAKVSNHGRAHAAVPAHQAVLHRRGQRSEVTLTEEDC